MSNEFSASQSHQSEPHQYQGGQDQSPATPEMQPREAVYYDAQGRPVQAAPQPAEYYAPPEYVDPHQSPVYYVRHEDVVYYYDHLGNPIQFPPAGAPVYEYIPQQEYTREYQEYPREYTDVPDAEYAATGIDPEGEPLDGENPDRPVTSAWRRPYLWASLPPFALLALSMALAGAPLPKHSYAGKTSNSTLTRSAAISGLPADMIVPASETFVISRQTGSHVLLRGYMEQPIGRTMVAPAGGQVARVAVKPGQVVKNGQEIVALSTHAVAESAPPMPSVNRSFGAERAQMQAMKAQQTWQGRVQDAHDRLVAAQKRVQEAEDRVARARDLVARLQKGETVDVSSVKAPPRPRVSRPENTVTAAERDGAIKESRRLQTIADDAASEAATARRAAVAAEQSVESKLKAWQDAQNVADSIEISRPEASSPGEGDEGKQITKPRDDGSAARKRAAQVRADSLKESANAASAKAISLRRTATRLAGRATSTQNKANDATRRAADMMSLRVFDNDEAAANDSQQLARGEGGKGISVREAIRIAKAAMDESRAAVDDANRIEAEVKSYENPVENTRERVDRANEQLSAAQEQMWIPNSSSSRGGVTPVTTPDAGVVLWVAELTREVSAGDPLAAVGRTDRLEVVLQDKSNAWKGLKPGATIMALVQDSSTLAARSDPMADPTELRRPVLNPGKKGGQVGVPTMARVLFVAPPAKAGMPALVRVAIHNPRRPGTQANPNANYGFIGRLFEPGTPVICSVAEPSTKNRNVLVIPTEAIRSDQEGNRYVAVLAPVQAGGQDVNADLCRVDWRKIELGRGDEIQHIVLSGLEQGERIALRPDSMQDFVIAHGAQATLRVEQA